MPTWDIIDHATGSTLTIEGDEPPSEADAAEIFSKQQKPSLPALPRAALSLPSFKLPPYEQAAFDTGARVTEPPAVDVAGLAQDIRHTPQYIQEAAHKALQPFAGAGEKLINLARLAQSGGKPMAPEDFIKPGESMIPAELIPPPEKKGIGPSVERFVAGSLTPEMAGVAPFAGLKAVQAGFGLTGAAGAVTAAEELANAKTWAEARGAGTDFLLSGAVAAAGLHGLGRETPVPGGKTLKPGDEFIMPPRAPAVARPVIPGALDDIPTEAKLKAVDNLLAQLEETHGPRADRRVTREETMLLGARESLQAKLDREAIELAQGTRVEAPVPQTEVETAKGTATEPEKVIGSAIRLKNGTIVKSPPGGTHFQVEGIEKLTQDDFSRDARDTGFYTNKREFVSQSEMEKLNPNLAQELEDLRNKTAQPEGFHQPPEPPVRGETELEAAATDTGWKTYLKDKSVKYISDLKMQWEGAPDSPQKPRMVKILADALDAAKKRIGPKAEAPVVETTPAVRTEADVRAELADVEAKLNAGTKAWLDAKKTNPRAKLGDDVKALDKRQKELREELGTVQKAAETPTVPAPKVGAQTPAPKGPIKPGREGGFVLEAGIIDANRRILSANRVLRLSPGELTRIGWKFDQAKKSGDLTDLDAIVKDLEQRAEEVKAQRGSKAARQFDAENDAGFAGDILDFVREYMKVMHKDAAKKYYSPQEYKELSAQWDDMPDNLPEHHMLIFGGWRKKFGKDFFGEGKSDSPTDVAQAAYRKGVLSSPDAPTLWRSIENASKARLDRMDKLKRESNVLGKDAAFAESISEAPGRTSRMVSELNEGDVLTIGGEKFTVKVDAEENVMLKAEKDSKFGSQELSADRQEPIWVEKHEPAAAGEVSFVPEETKTAEAPKAEPTEAGPEFLGGGAAALGETRQIPAGRPSGIKVADIDRLRSELGLPGTEIIRGETDQALWDSVMARWDREGDIWPNSLEAEIGLGRRRQLNQEETVMLAIRKMQMENSLNVLLRNFNSAVESGMEALQPGLQQEISIMSSRLADFLQRLRETGTEQGRAFRLRRLMVNRDYSPAQMEMEWRASLGERARGVTDEEWNAIRKELADTKNKLDDLTKKGEASEKEWRQKIAEAQADKAIADAKAAAAGEAPKYDKSVLDAAKKFIDSTRPAANAARERLRQKYNPRPSDAPGTTTTAFAGIDVSDLTDLIGIAYQEIAEFSWDLAKLTEDFVKDFGEGIRPEMPNIFAAAQKLKDERTARLARPVRRVVLNMDANDKISAARDAITTKLTTNRPDEVFPDLERMIRGIAERSPDFTRDQVVDEVWTFLRDINPNITRQETLEAISGYGKFTDVKKDAVSATVGRWKGELRQIAKLYWMEVLGRKPLGSGQKRRVAEAEERRLIKVVNDVKRRNPDLAGSADPAKDLQSALDSRKTFRRNQIADLEFEIRQREKILRDKAPPPTDPELDALVARVAELKKEQLEIFGRPELTEAQRAEREAASLDRQIAETERQLKEGDIFFKKKDKFESPANEAKRAQLEALKAERQFLRDAINPKKVWRSPEERWLVAFEARMKREIANYEERLAKGDFSKRARPTPPPIPERLMRMKVEKEKIQQDYETALEKNRLLNRTKPEKIVDAAVKLHQMFVISGIKSIAKLGSAMVEGIAFLMGRELVGAAYSKFPGLRGIAEKTTKEGGLDLQAMGTAFAKTLRMLIEDAGKNIRGEKMDFERYYGGFRKLPEDLRNYVGNLHGVLKGPLGRYAFEQQYAKARNRAAMQGIDVTSTEVDMMIGASAYLDSQFWRLQNRNHVTQMFRTAVQSLEQAAKKKGAPANFWTKGGSAFLRLELPVVTVPTNMVLRLFENIGGVPSGAGMMLYHAMKARNFRGMSFRDAVANLKPEEADLIMRQLKSGTIGMAFVTLGLLYPENFGGYYQPGKRKEEDVKFGNLRVAGMEVPSLLIHNPFLEAAQFGATIRRVMQKKNKMSDEETHGVIRATLEATMGAIEQQPFVREAFDIETLRHGAFESFLGGRIRSYAIPMAVQNIAQWTDADVKRSPKNLLEHIEMGIPGMRQKVPEKKSAGVYQIP